MDIKEFQEEVVRTFGEMGNVPNRNDHTKQSAVIHLMEEIGEIARQTTNEYHRPEKFSKENLAEELSDAMMFLVLLAELYDVDISEEMKKSIKKVEVGTNALREEFFESKD
jgi:NTP pyrophosphatase (non-canonical NTP hydrolase)